MPAPDDNHPSETARPSGAAALIAGPIQVINVGLPGFAADLQALGVGVVHVDWVPPASGDADLARLLAKLGT